MKQKIRRFLLSFGVAWALVAGLFSMVSPSDGGLSLLALYVVPVYVKMERGFDGPVTSLFVVLCVGSICVQLAFGWFIERVVSHLLGEPTFIRRVIWQLGALAGQVVVIIGVVRVLTATATAIVH